MAGKEEKKEGGKKEEGEELSLRKTRKAFLVEYGCGFFLIVLLGILLAKGIKVNRFIFDLAAGVALVALLGPEISRLRHRYKINPSKVVFIHGIIKRDKKYVFIDNISDIQIKQTLWQRLWDYGSIVIVPQSGEERSMDLKEISDPLEIMEEIEEMMEKARKKSHGREGG